MSAEALNYDQVQQVADLLHETSIRHGDFEAATPAHDWGDWYAAYFVARQAGAEAGEAVASADSYMADVKNVRRR